MATKDSKECPEVEIKPKEEEELLGAGGNNSVVVVNKNSRHHGYGIGGWEPKALQCLANRKAFLVIFCLTCVLQGTFHTYFVAVITTLEKLFNIPSQTIGTLMMASEIGQVSSALVLPYYAGSGHRPRWMGVGSALFSLATLLCASPHILISAPSSLLTSSTSSNYSSQFCTFENNSTMDCNDNNELLRATMESGAESSKYLLFAIIFTSLLTIGFGQTAIFTLGIPYLDDNVANRDSPLYFSITIGVRILGPVCGFILGSLCTRLYINPGSPPSDYGPTDPRWLGAWWLGMLIISSLLFLTSILMFAFPRQLKAQPGQIQHNQSTVNNLRNFPVALKRLLSNRILVLRTFSSVFHLLPISGLYTFLPKYLESQFRLAAFQANMVTGIAGILVMGIGIFGSGVFIRRKEPSAKNIALWVAMAAFVYSGGMGGLAFIGCESSKDFALQQPNPLGKPFSTPSCLTSGCNECSPKQYAPVCGQDDMIYFSACHAGCPPQNINNVSAVYVNCACVGVDHAGAKAQKQSFQAEGGAQADRSAQEESFQAEGGAQGGQGAPFQAERGAQTERRALVDEETARLTEEDWSQTASPGLCDLSCPGFPYYQALFMLIVLIHSTSEVGSMLLTLRCVEPRDKAMALGLIQCAIGLFGNVPCPVIYGAVVDSACVIWGDSSASSCGEEEDIGGGSQQGHCWVYDSHTFRTRFHGLTGLLMLLAFTIDLVIYKEARNINFLEDEEEEEGKDEKEMKELQQTSVIL